MLMPKREYRRGVINRGMLNVYNICKHTIYIPIFMYRKNEIKKIKKEMLYTLAYVINNVKRNMIIIRLSLHIFLHLFIRLIVIYS